MTPQTRKPLLIVAAMHESHVRATIMCCNETNVLMRIRSGGHDYEALSYTANIPFVILDTFNLRGIDVNLEDDTAWVEAGVLLGELYYRIAEKRGTELQVLLEREWHKKNYLKSKSDFVTKAVSKPELEKIFQKMMQLGDIIMQWNPYGGRMNNISESAVPLPQRAGYLFKIQYIVYWTHDGKANAEQNMQNSREFYEFMAPYVTSSPREAFLNYRDLDIGQNPMCNASYATAKAYNLKYFKGNFERLVKIKTAVDPTNFFRNEQSIPTLPM
ncbi:hypothetical protein ACET3Z_000494 [Daucus carota]